MSFLNPVSSDQRDEAIAKVKLNGVANSSKSDLAIVQEAAKYAGSAGNTARDALGKA